MAKLLVHGIPIKVGAEDLHEVIPGDFTIEVKVKIIMLISFSVSYLSITGHFC